MTDEQRIVTASGVIDAPAADVFEKIADPAVQPSWDGNGNLGSAEPGQRVTKVGDVFTTILVSGTVVDNRVVEFEEGTLIAWLPVYGGGEPFGHLWRWEVTPLGDAKTQVTQTYDWTELTVEQVFPRAQSQDETYLKNSIEKLAASF